MARGQGDRAAHPPRRALRADRRPGEARRRVAVARPGRSRRTPAHARRADLHGRAAVYERGRAGGPLRRGSAHAGRGQRPPCRRKARARRLAQGHRSRRAGAWPISSPRRERSGGGARPSRGIPLAAHLRARRRADRLVGHAVLHDRRARRARCAATPASASSWLFGSFTAGLFVSGVVSPAIGREIDARGRPTRAGGGIGARRARLRGAGHCARSDARCSPAGCWRAWRWRRACTIPRSRRCTRSRAHRIAAPSRRSRCSAGFASTVFWPLSQFLLDTDRLAPDVRGLCGTASRRCACRFTCVSVPAGRAPGTARADDATPRRAPRIGGRVRVARDRALARGLHRFRGRRAPRRLADRHRHVGARRGAGRLADRPDAGGRTRDGVRVQPPRARAWRWAHSLSRCWRRARRAHAGARRVDRRARVRDCSTAGPTAS